jgi:hypothetical protein
MTAHELGRLLLAQEFNLEVRVSHPSGHGSAGVRSANWGNWGDFCATWLNLEPYMTASEAEKDFTAQIAAAIQRDKKEQP